MPNWMRRRLPRPGNFPSSSSPTATRAFQAPTPLCSKISPATGTPCSALSNPYEATAATLADGRVVTLLDNAGTLLPPIREVFGEWGPEEETMAAVTRTADEAEQLRLLRGYLAGLGRTNVALRRWVDDTKLVLDRLSSVPPKSPAGQLAVRLDISRLGVFGHSMGGVTAGQFCVEDRRCRAGLNLDGIPQYGTMINKSMPRPFLMVYSARPGRSGASDAIYRRAAHPYYRVDVRDTRHLDFSDMAFWSGPLRERPVLGTIAPARVSEISGVIVRQYFDQELWGSARRCWQGRLFSRKSASGRSRHLHAECRGDAPAAA